MQKKVLNMLPLAILMIACENTTEPTVSSKDEANDNEVTLVLKMNTYGMEQSISDLDSLESIEIPIEIESIIGDNAAITRAIPATEITGTITNTGNHKVVFKYGSGQNLVPSYLCGTGIGNATISTVYQIKASIKLTDNMFAKGIEGEYSGWKEVFIVNTQEQYQYVRGTNEEPIYMTFCYHILSTFDGWTLPNGGLEVPYPKEQIRLYAQIVCL